MRVIFIMTDSFRRDHIGAYGNKWIHTPNLDRLAAMSNVFDSHHIGSFPTLSNRRDMHLGHPGHKTVPFNPWMGIDKDETSMAERLCDAGVHTMMVNDVANSCLHTRTVQNKVSQINMNKGFEFFIGNRGQEADNFFSDDEVPLTFPVDPSLIRYPASGWHKVLMNRARMIYDDDFFAPGTFKLACQWLERNFRRDNFMLWVETFDPHEPWDPPAFYVERYDPNYQGKGRVFEAPSYGYVKEMGMTDAEVKHMQALYAGEVTMVDAAVGRLLATLDKVNLLDDVAIVFTTDHGEMISHPGDNGLVGKPTAVGPDGMAHSAGEPIKSPVRHLPQYTGVTRIPLFIHLPGQSKQKRFQQITQPWDIAPTVLQMFNQPVPADHQGFNLLNLINGTKKTTRKAAILGTNAAQIQANNLDWSFTLFSRPENDNHKLETMVPYLIDLKNDPLQKKNVARKYPEVCKAMYKEIETYLRRQPNVPETFLENLILD